MKTKNPRIKNPTLRKILNRGLLPVRYHMQSGFHHGWVVARGRKWLRVYIISYDKVLRVPITEERYMQELAA